jgi:hypothetical protein
LEIWSALENGVFPYLSYVAKDCKYFPLIGIMAKIRMLGLVKERAYLFKDYDDTGRLNGGIRNG